MHDDKTTERSRSRMDWLGHISTLALGALLVQVALLARYGSSDPAAAQRTLLLFAGSLLAALLAMVATARRPEGTGCLVALVRWTAWLLFAAGVASLVFSATRTAESARNLDEAPAAQASNDPSAPPTTKLGEDGPDPVFDIQLPELPPAPSEKKGI